MKKGHRQSLSERVFQHLSTQLALKEFKVGERLNTQKITEELSVSRTTLKRAFDQLVKNRWIVISKTGHATVIAYPSKPMVKAVPTFDFLNQTDRSYETLLEQILKGDLQPGHVIKERPVSVQLGVNPATVRRAAEWLSRDGLLVRIPRRGWRVTLLDSSDLKDIFKIRMLLEPLALEGAIHGMTDELLDQLEAETSKIITLGESATVEERRKADHHFHISLCEAARSKVLKETIDPLLRRVLLVTTVGFRYGRVSQSFVEHQKILEAIRNRDPQKAVELLQAHLSASYSRNLETWERAMKVVAKP